MLEEWAWSRETLDQFARHHSKGDLIPGIDSSRRCEHARSRTCAQHPAAALFSPRSIRRITRMNRASTSTKLLEEEFHAKYTPFKFVEGTHFQASFGHLMGYDAGYYGYQWALCFRSRVRCLTKNSGRWAHEPSDRSAVSQRRARQGRDRRSPTRRNVPRSRSRRHGVESLPRREIILARRAPRATSCVERLLAVHRLRCESTMRFLRRSRSVRAE